MSMQPDLRVALSPDDVPARVAAEVRAWMGRRGYRQKHLAAELGVSQQTVSAKYKGTAPFTLKDLARIAAWLGISLAELMGEAAGVPPQGGPGQPGRSSAGNHLVNAAAALVHILPGAGRALSPVPDLMAA